MTHTTSGAQSECTEYPRVYRHLMRVGLLGIMYGIGDDARIVNEAVEATLEDSKAYRLVMTVVLGMAGNTSRAREVLGLDSCAQEPEDDPSRIALAVAQAFSGDEQWRRWIDQVLACSVDQDVRQTARDVADMAKRLH